MNSRLKQLRRIKKKYKHLVAAVAGVAILSSVMLPGLPIATAHASENSNGASNRFSTSQIFSEHRLNSPIQMSSGGPAIVLPVKEIQLVSKVQPNPDGGIIPDTSVPPKVLDIVAAPVTAKAPSGNAPTEYQQVINVTATAYGPGPQDNDQWGSKTFIGTEVRPGIIAVDPKVIPLRSRVYIQYPDGHGEYAVAEDTGGAIKGNRIDIAMKSHDIASDFGIQKVKVFVVSTPKDI